MNWPTSLPQNVDKNGFSYSPQSGVIRTEMEAGYPKTRRRYTAVNKDLNFTMTMTPLQVEVFEQFFETSISFGSEIFSFPDPMWYPGPLQDEGDRPLIDMRFNISAGSEAYSCVPDGDSLDFRVSFKLERIP